MKSSETPRPTWEGRAAQGLWGVAQNDPASGGFGGVAQNPGNLKASPRIWATPIWVNFGPSRASRGGLASQKLAKIEGRG